MLSILNQVKQEICPICAVGNPIQILGYKASGSCMDYVFKNYKIPYSIAWEIYTNEKKFKEMNDYITAKNIQNNPEMPPNNNSMNIVNPNYKIFLESSTQVYLKEQSYRKLLKARDFSEKENRFCFKLFNPASKDSYDYIIETWRKVSFNLIISCKTSN